VRQTVVGFKVPRSGIKKRKDKQGLEDRIIMK
jgi:hypothetical protein